jgi:hypothetical protein
MAETSHVAARRWLQFRLRTLLLAPVFILLLQVFSDQLFDHLIALWCAYGALFGVAWAVGRMRIVGLRRTGLARVLPVAKAAFDGGMIGGALLGAPVLWTALWRSGAWRYFNARDVASDAWEFFTSGVAGYWCGGFVGALAGGAVGTVAAYFVCLAARAFRAQDWFQGPANHEATANAAARQTRGWRLYGRLSLVIALAVGPPIWLATCLLGDWHEREIVDRLRMRAGFYCSREPYGPHWFENDIAPGYELKWFRRVRAVYNYGRIERQAFDDLSRLTHVRQIYFRLDSDADVIAAAAWLRRRPDVQASIELNGTRITDDGLSVFRELGNVDELSIDKTCITDASIDTIKSLTSLKRFNFRGPTNVGAESQFQLRLFSIVPPVSPPPKR